MRTVCNLFNLDKIQKLAIDNQNKIDQWEKEQKEISKRQWLYASGIPERYKNATCSFKWNGKQNVLLTGVIGGGKTHTACSLLLRECKGFYITMFDIKQKLKQFANFSTKTSEYEFLQEVANKTILVIDEIGRVDKDFEAKTLFYIVNERYNKKLPTILCTNLSVSDLEMYVGFATIDRLRENCVLQTVKGTSRRGSKL